MLFPRVASSLCVAGLLTMAVALPLPTVGEASTQGTSLHTHNLAEQKPQAPALHHLAAQTVASAREGDLVRRGVKDALKRFIKGGSSEAQPQALLKSAAKVHQQAALYAPSYELIDKHKALYLGIPSKSGTVEEKVAYAKKMKESGERDLERFKAYYHIQ